MGYIPHEHPNIPQVQEAIKRVLAAAKAAGKYAGMVGDFLCRFIIHFQVHNSSAWLLTKFKRDSSKDVSTSLILLL